MELTNYNSAKADVCRMIIERSRKKLKTKQSRTVITAKWTKHGRKWIAYDIKRSKKLLASKTTGNLARSMKYFVKENYMLIQTINYGRWVDLGRKPGKGVPVSDLEAWMKKKGIRVSSFLINRKIKFFGIEATKFLTNSITELGDKIPEYLMDAYMKDLENELERMWKDLGKDAGSEIVRGKGDNVSSGKFFWKRGEHTIDVVILKYVKSIGAKSILKLPSKFEKSYNSYAKIITEYFVFDTPD